MVVFKEVYSWGETQLGSRCDSLRIVHKYSNTTCNMDLFRSISASEISLPFSIFPNYFLPFFSLFYTYLFSPFPSSLLLSLSRSMLSHFFRTTGSRVGRLADIHLHPHPRIMSLINYHAILYLVDFAVTGSLVGEVEFSHPMFRDTHFGSKRSVIYILTIRPRQLLSITSLIC
jgi:hypothetical protein